MLNLRKKFFFIIGVIVFYYLYLWVFSSGVSTRYHSPVTESVVSKPKPNPIKGRLLETIYDLRSQIDSFKKKYQTTVSQNKTLKKEITALNVVVLNGEKALTKTTKKHENVLKEVHKKHENVLKEVNEKHENVLKEVNEKHENVLKEVNEKHEKNIASFKVEYDQKLDNQKEQFLVEKLELATYSEKLLVQNHQMKDKIKSIVEEWPINLPPPQLAKSTPSKKAPSRKTSSVLKRLSKDRQIKVRDELNSMAGETIVVIEDSKFGKKLKFNQKIFFRKGEIVPPKREFQKLKKLKHLKKVGLQKIKVLGFTDPSPIKRQKGFVKGNRHLAKLRATIIAEYLIENLKFPKDKIEIEGHIDTLKNVSNKEKRRSELEIIP